MTAWLRRGAASAFVAGLALAVVGLVAGPAAAHDELVAVTPADGQSLEQAPTVVVLEFAGELLTLGEGTNRVVVVDTADEEVVAEGGDVDGSVLRLLLDPLPDGAYEVRYRAVSGDSHVVEGTTTFFVGGVPSAGSPPPSTPIVPGAPGAPTTVPGPDPTDAGTSSASGPTTAQSTDPVTVPAVPDDPDDADDGGGPSTATVVVIVLALVVALVGGAALSVLVRRARGAGGGT